MKVRRELRNANSTREPLRRSRIAFLGRTALIVSGVITMTGLFGHRADDRHRGQNDFLPLYVAATLVPGDDLYEPNPYDEFSIDRFGMRFPTLRFTRPPFYALGLKPLTWLSYPTASTTWMAVQLSAMAAAPLVWGGGGWWFVLAAVCWSVPVAASLLNGQDVVLLPLILCGACWAQRDRPFMAGFLLSLCAIKFHLFLALPLLFIRRRGLVMFGGFIGGALLLLTLSFVAAGRNWPAEYWALLTDPIAMQVGVDGERLMMPNLHGMVTPLPGRDALEWILAGSVLVATAVAVPALAFEPALACVVAGGVLISHHAFIADWVLVLFACLLMWRHAAKGSGLRYVLLALMAPPLALLQVVGRAPYTSIPAAALLVAWVWFLCESQVRRRLRPEPASIGLSGSFSRT